MHIINLRRLVSVLFIFAQYGELSTRPGRSAGDSERRGDCLESASQCLIVRRKSASASLEVIVSLSLRSGCRQPRPVLEILIAVAELK